MKVKKSGLVSMIVMAVAMLVVVMLHLEQFNGMKGIFAGVNLLLCVLTFFVLIYVNADRVSPHLYVMLCYVSLVSILMYYRWLDFQDASRLTTEILFKPSSTLLTILLAYAVGAFFAERELYKYKIVQFLLMFAGPAAFLLARITGGSVNGSYNWLFGVVMPSEVSKVSFVFAVIYVTYAGLVTKQKIKWFLTYVAIQVLACVIANEFGTMVLIVLSSFIFCLCDKDLRASLTLFVTCGVALSVLVLLVSAKVRARMLIFINPAKAIAAESDYVSGQAAIVQRFLSNIKYSGWLGSGYQLPRSSMPPNMTTDYVWQTMILDYGKLFCILAILMVLCVLFYLLASTANSSKDRKIVDSIVILLIANTAISAGGNLLVLPLTGLTAPFVSLVSSAQSSAIFYFLLGFALSLTKKREEA